MASLGSQGGPTSWLLILLICGLGYGSRASSVDLGFGGLERFWGFPVCGVGILVRVVLAQAFGIWGALHRFGLLGFALLRPVLEMGVSEN